MAQVQQRLLIGAWLAAGLHAVPCAAQSPQPRTFNEFRDFMANTFGTPGERHSGTRRFPSRNVDARGEVPDSTWYENRHASRRMSIAELVRGAGDANPPSPGPWTVIAAKREGVTPGFEIRDARGRKYLLKFDPPECPELASGAEVVSSKFFYALGYHVPENYIVTFDRARLVAAADGNGGEQIGEDDIDRELSFLRKDAQGRYRALASLYLEGKPLGPFLFHGMRGDDPEDAIPHEHRRELRGLYVMSAWLNHTDSKAGNTLDMLVTEQGRRRVKHYLIDFGATLGSATIQAKSPRQGHEYMVELKPSLAQLITLGIYVPKWARAKLPEHPAVGSFEAEVFEPDKWKPNYPNPAFENRLPDDIRWGARKVTAFRDDEIRAIVATGRYSDPRAAEWIARTLIERRDKIARAFAAPAPGPGGFRINGSRLEFESPGGGRGTEDLRVQWLWFDSAAGRAVPAGGAGSFDVPEVCAGALCAARITGRRDEAVTVYVAKGEVAAVDRDK